MILSKLHFIRNSLVAGRWTFWEDQVRRQHEQVRGDGGLSALGVRGRHRGLPGTFRKENEQRLMLD